MGTWRLIFFAVFVPMIWFGVHYYIGRRLFERTLWRKTTRRAGWSVLIGLATVSLFTQMGGRLGLEGAWMDPLFWVTYIYMGFFSMVLVATLLAHIAQFATRRLRKASDAGAAMALVEPQAAAPSGVDTGRRAFLRGVNMGILGLSGVMTSFGVHKALRTLDVVDVEVPIKDLPEALEGFRIVQISDLHVGPTIRRPFVEKVVAQANMLEADVIAITGDLIDGYVEQRRNDVEPLGQLKAREGVYYVTGNHEYYWGAQPWIDEVTRLGITALSNAHRIIERGGAKLAMAGVTDLKAGQFDPKQASDPHKAIAGIPAEAVKVLLAHQPRSAFEAAKAGFDLQLSGHTHGGQFVPWSFIVWLAQPFVAGLHMLDGMRVYVSRGTGYWGPPVRVAADPEITRLTLVRG